MFCLTYYPFHKYLQDVEQLKINYNPSDTTLDDFLKTNLYRTIIIDISYSFEETDAKLIKALSLKYKNIKVIFDFCDKEILDLVIKYNIPFFFINPVTSMDQLYGLLNYNPTDMYICEDLGFCLDKVNNILKDKNIKIRVFPNICQSSFPDTPSLKTFFIRPEDISIYATFVDIFEIVADENTQEMLYKIYKEGKWFGKIKEIIPSFKDELDSRYLIESFGMIRSKCGKRCLYKPGSCNICDRLEKTQQTLKEGQIVIRKARKK